MLWIQISLIIYVLNSDIVIGQYRPPTPKVIFYKNRGFEVSIDGQRGIRYFEVRYKKNEPFDAMSIEGQHVVEKTNDRFVYINFYEKFNIGDILYYSCYVIYNDIPQELQHFSEHVKGFGTPSLPLKDSLAKKVKFDFLEPFGFEVSYPKELGVSFMTFNGQFNKPFNTSKQGDVTAFITPDKVVDFRLTYRDADHRFKIGDKFYFWISLIAPNGHSFDIPQQIYVYIREPNCSIGLTKQEGVSICSDSQIFSDDFEEDLNLSTWSFERKFGTDPDYEFVLYSNQTVKVSQGVLHMTLSENPIKTAMYEIPDCTGILKSPECVYDRSRTIDVMAPILSSRISTKNSFSFKYGRIEVRAKFPNADWTVPFIILEPKYSKYDKDQYKSGQIRIASLANNPTNSTIKQGPLLGAKEPFRTSFMNSYSVNSDWFSKYHTISVEWRPDGIKTFIDGNQAEIENWRKSSLDIPGSEAWRNSEIPVTPFDQECYISIGVSVGGINDFQSGTTWDLRSPSQKR